MKDLRKAAAQAKRPTKQIALDAIETLAEAYPDAMPELGMLYKYFSPKLNAKGAKAAANNPLAWVALACGKGKVRGWEPFLYNDAMGLQDPLGRFATVATDGHRLHAWWGRDASAEKGFIDASLFEVVHPPYSDQCDQPHPGQYPNWPKVTLPPGGDVPDAMVTSLDRIKTTPYECSAETSLVMLSFEGYAAGVVDELLFKEAQIPFSDAPEQARVVVKWRAGLGPDGTPYRVIDRLQINGLVRDVWALAVVMGILEWVDKDGAPANCDYADIKTI